MTNPGLQSSRIQLRDYAIQDFHQVHEFCSAPEVVQYQDWGPNSERQTTDFIQACIQETSRSPRLSYNLAIVSRTENHIIGGCALFIRQLDCEAEIGFSLNPKYWNQGYATETAGLLLELGFAHLKLHRIYATCRPENIASKSVLKKIGMTTEGLLREHRLVRGTWQDSVLLSILEREWRLRHKADQRRRITKYT